MTPIKEVQITMEVPTKGANNLDPTSSKTMTAPPQRKTTVSSEYFDICHTLSNESVYGKAKE